MSWGAIFSRYIAKGHDHGSAAYAADQWERRQARAHQRTMTTLPYVYRWNRQGRKGQKCEVIARGTMNSCCVRFADGYTMVTSRNALAKVKEAP
ncbi:hypothetical protein G6K93_05945 [Agrobacterium rhizogenes]|nr:hypothetical protein [Rhizobium rhizogenes]